ncbi:xanthine dehydrogenase family protein molybdopterin-binding subunit [Nonomuraea lactucae]|uniref:xanthine dehydrogenase family protein molybdopterin-binding subunit n=1 Tax=Nonomuraea lactucae TaxID=2249762 RepID=UPI001964036E|nr:xanthine dehydrogenase family protein molybdopterin-binding subunit [Nonomuraea lactucae]
MTSAMNEPRPAGVLIGQGLDRLDGPLKVTGAAPYPSDFDLPGMAYASLVRSTIASGRISRIDRGPAEAAPGVLAVVTHENAPKLGRGPKTILGAAPPPPLRDDRILHHGQFVAVVVAETAEQAAEAARLVQPEYDAADPVLDLADPRAKVRDDPWHVDMRRGNLDAGLAAADVTFQATYTTPENTNNPLGLFATVAAWEGDTLTVHDSTQWPYNTRGALARSFGVPERGVRVLAPFVGGGFGSGLRAWPHVILAALAARIIERPVKLVLTRPQMFTAVGHRPNTVQNVRLGATRDGRLLAIEHTSDSPVAMEDDNLEPITLGTSTAYACPNLITRDRQIRLNVPCPGSMRAPGEAQGNFALESALDELSYDLGMDPVRLRLVNESTVHPQTGLPWSSRAMRECYLQGAERFGWSLRSPEPRSMRDGDWLVGYGMAGASFLHYQAKCQARASIDRDGTAYVRSAGTDIGTGTYTVMTQLAAETLGLRTDRVRLGLGDTDLPMAPQAGGSGLTGALGGAVHAACVRLVHDFLRLVRNDPESPLRGCDLEDITLHDGRIQRTDDPTRGETYAGILARHGLEELTADGDSSPPRGDMIALVGSMVTSRLGRFGRAAVRATRAVAPAGACGAKFVEVRVDPDLGLLRVTRIVSVIDGGRILNEKTARSQITGAVVGGIGMAMFEETITDAGTGRIANATFGDYLIAVNADIPEMDVHFVGEPDPANPIGTKGVGEIGLVGIAPAIANAVYHATGRRVRSLPITIDRLL